MSRDDLKKKKKKKLNEFSYLKVNQKSWQCAREVNLMQEETPEFSYKGGACWQKFRNLNFARCLLLAHEEL